MQSMQLYLIRHPLPEIAPGICYGQSDIAANDSHCRFVLPQLQSALPAGIPVFSSPLQRCARIASLLHPAPVLDARLMEMHFGKWEMQSWDAIDRAEIDAWAADVVGYAPGGGESVIAMAARVIHFLEDLTDNMSADVAIVAHAGSMRLMLAYEAGMQAGDLAARVAREKKHLQFGECIKLQIKLC
ncbi:MAG: histidine phosphatase family protein [Undibacterium sp.]|nr:histidine phosphatase family protein [Undibacterium sp.]